MTADSAPETSKQLPAKKLAIPILKFVAEYIVLKIGFKRARLMRGFRWREA
jgi:hypothetical protein